MIGRFLVSIGIFLSGYYIGKQMGLTEHIRKDMEEKRNHKQMPREHEESGTKTRRRKKTEQQVP